MSHYSYILKVYKLRENKEENSNTNYAGGLSSPKISVSKQRHEKEGTFLRHAKKPMTDKTDSNRKHNHVRPKKNLRNFKKSFLV